MLQAKACKVSQQWRDQRKKRSSLVSTLFKSVADSDVVWENFLPADYQDIIPRAFYPFPSAAALSKKELYYHPMTHFSLMVVLRAFSWKNLVERNASCLEKRSLQLLGVMETLLVLGLARLPWLQEATTRAGRCLCLCLRLRGEKLRVALLSKDTVEFCLCLTFQKGRFKERLQEHKVKSRIGRAEKEEMVETSEDIINNLERLPEGCISDILSLITSPADVCRSRLVSTLFKSAADSDALWEKFLPADYQDIISRAFYPFPSAAALSKKELYYRLCNEPLLIDGGLKSFQLEKSSGKKCIMLGAKELDSAWGDNPQHWYWRGYPGSRYAKVAELKWSCWLEIHGKLKTRLLSPKTFYAAYFVLKFKQDVYGFDNEHIKANVEVVVSLNLDPRRTPKCCKPLFGYFYNEELEDDEGGEVHMSVLQNESLGAKYYGLIVQGM
ncbi:hypothetical protein MKX01_040550 [Papaver californicum]|nr:hypothetical protein MKX01_040550 [Papaver californicum]